jgi:hypothetical protein
MTFQDFSNIYDFTLIEKAVQGFFVGVPGGSFVAPLDDDDPNREQWTAGADNIAFYTAFQSLTFQQCRPRVYISAFQFSSVRGAYAIDASGAIREKAWSGTMRLGIVTDAKYQLHTQLRAQVLAIIPQMTIVSADGSAFAAGGINARLQYHQVSELWVKDNTTTVVPQEGNYQSTINLQLAFSVLPTAWPAGMQTY